MIAKVLAKNEKSRVLRSEPQTESSLRINNCLQPRSELADNFLSETNAVEVTNPDRIGWNFKSRQAGIY